MLVLCLAFGLAAVAHARPVVTLITVGPGDEVWERFGHNMLRLQDADSGFDACYNWGIFDFNQPNFIGNFVRGRMLYSMRALDTASQLDEYRQQNRRVTFQVLKLSDAESHDLILRCETNRLPANRDYRYDYFKDNCSTRVRDALDAVYAGRLGAMANKGRPLSPVVTIRTAFMRLMWDDFWLSLGADFTLGPAVDKPLDGWAACFLPGQVAKLATPLAEPATEPWTSTRPPEHAGPPRRWPWLLATGFAFATLVFAASAWRPWAGRTLGNAWWLVSGFAGLFLTYIWLFTDHTAAYANQNLLHFSPLGWAVLLLQIVRRRRAAAGLAGVIVAVCVLGTVGHGFGALGQKDLGFILLALPVNLAAARSLTTPPAPDEVAGHADDGGSGGGVGGGGIGDGHGRLRPERA